MACMSSYFVGNLIRDCCDLVHHISYYAVCVSLGNYCCCCEPMHNYHLQLGRLISMILVIMSLCI